MRYFIILVTVSQVFSAINSIQNDNLAASGAVWISTVSVCSYHMKGHL